jgi:eukaryotic-like serine/threonine-protein kinase
MAALSRFSTGQHMTNPKPGDQKPQVPPARNPAPPRGTSSQSRMRISPLPPRQPGTPVAPPTRKPAEPKTDDGEVTQRIQPQSGKETDKLDAKDKPAVQFRAEPDPTLEETQDMDPADVEPPQEPVSGEARISFGQAAVKLGLVTPAQIQECVNIQRATQQKGQRVPLLGQLLLQREYLDRIGVDRIKGYQQMYRIADKIPGYKLTEKLGQGAMGTVYKARQVRMERWVAIKVLQPELAANATIKQRFLQEARASARLNHPNVITGIDAGEVDGLCYFAMEYVEGKTLQQLVRERGAMDERQALELIVQVARALEHAEKLGLVHRDIKPDNIMVTRERVVKLLDLGLAKLRADGENISRRNVAVGTPNYISPEQATGHEDIDTRSDIYSLGVTLFYCLTARIPFEGPPEVVMYRHIHEPPPHPKNFRPDLAETTCTLLKTMMAKRPEDRQASAMQLVSDMEQLLRTGKLPGFSETPPPAQGLRLRRDTGPQRRKPKLRGYNPSPPPPAPGVGPASPPAEEDDGGPRLPRKRRRRFGGSW